MFFILFYFVVLFSLYNILFSVGGNKNKNMNKQFFHKIGNGETRDSMCPLHEKETLFLYSDTL